MTEDQTTVDQRENPESTTSPSEKTSQPTVTEMLQSMLRECAANALEYKRKIASAKTDYKKKYYKKKLDKNNDEAMRVLASLEKLGHYKKSKQAKNESGESE